MRILHIAPFNTAGVPMAFVRAERKMGHDSRLITLGPSRQERNEDICLRLEIQGHHKLYLSLSHTAKGVHGRVPIFEGISRLVPKNPKFYHLGVSFPIRS